MGDVFTDAAKTDRGRLCERCKKERGAWVWEYFYCGPCGFEVQKEGQAKPRRKKR